MRFWFVIGSSATALVMFSGAMADQQGPATTPAVHTIIQIATVTQEISQFAANAMIAPLVAETAATPSPAPANSKNPGTAAKRGADGKIGRKADQHAGGGTYARQLAAVEPKSTQIRIVGKSQTGTAAWYGGRYVGQRTSSGERLDTTHATAAHRTLPLNTLVRVTNLRTGRSVVVRVTDRGPLDPSLLIDMSPRAADELHMKDAGLIPVRVEQVVEVPPDAK
jgi:rare lipoprotein A (peptidoglycan hydrolase)